MNNVSCRLWGKCWGDPAQPARLVVKWAGQQVFDGTVPTSGDQPDAKQNEHHEVLCTWTVDNVTAGTVPVEITVHNGSASINNILMNNITPARYVHFTADVQEIYGPYPPRSNVNVRIFTAEEFLALYQFPEDSPPAYVQYVDVPAVDNWTDGNINRRLKNGEFHDGKFNVKLNGQDWWSRMRQPGVEATVAEFLAQNTPPSIIKAHNESGTHMVYSGERNYFFTDGNVLSFDYLIEWPLA